MRSLGVSGLRLVSVTEPSSPSAPTSSTLWSSTASPTGSATGSRGPAQPTVRSPSSTLEARARFAYRISGFDTVDRTFDINVSLKCSTAAHEHLQVATWTPYDRPQPWDLPDLTVRRSATSLVLAASPQQAADLLARAESAQAHVAAVWGRSRPAVWIAPPTDSEAALLLGRAPADPSALHDVAAVTDGPLQPGRPAGADRIVIVPTVWSSLPGRGREVVATHELTHVVVRGSTTGPVPLWLSEGFAEFVAYRTVALSEHAIVHPALEAARRDGLPTGLPSDQEFDPATGSVAAAYGRSLLVLRTLADREGVAALVRFYREVADPTDQARAATAPARDDADHHDAVDAALTTVLHTDRTALVRSWRARMRQLLS